MNPLATLDALLADWASPRVRRLVHALLALILIIVTAVLAAGGDWEAALISLVGTVYAALNKANTPAVDLDSAGVSTGEDDDLTYEEAGGLDFPEDPGTALYGTQPPLYQPGSDAEGFGGDAPLSGPENGSQRP